MDKKTALLYARLNSFKHLVNKTSGFIKWALSKVDNPYVACSFGKDSAVLLHLVLLHSPNIAIRFIRWKNETEHIDNYDDVIKQWGNINLEQVVLSRDSLSDKRKDRYATTNYDSYFIGLRQEESAKRRITLKANGMFFTNKSGVTRISPLSDWTVRDISAYAFSRELPLLKSYLDNSMESRTSSRIPREDYGIRHNFLADLKRRDINSFQVLLSKFPEVKDYV